MSKLLATVKNTDGEVTITYHRGPQAGYVETVEPGYLVHLYGSGCLLPILIVLSLIAILVS